MKKIFILLWAISYIAMTSCNHNTDNHNHSQENDTHVHDEAAEQSKEHDHDHETAQMHEEEVAHEHSAVQNTGESHQHEYRTQKIELQSFNEIINSSGQIIVPPSNQIDVVASSAGKVVFANKQASEGLNVSANEALFLISGKELIENNIDLKYQQSLINFEKIKTDYERAQKLLADQIISEKEFQQIKAEYEKSKAEYEIFSNQFSKGGTTITTPVAGFIHEMLVTEGQFVEQGQMLARIIKKDKLRLRAEVSQKYAGRIKDIQSANFVPNGSGKVYHTEKLTGKLLSAGQSLNSSGFYIPVIFEMDYHPALFPGSYAQVFLKGKTIHHSVVIPKTALLEEQGDYYVFVEKQHDEFEKRLVVTGVDDGDYVLIESGLDEGETLVTEGVYQVKLTNMSNELPAHNHSH
ncbi:MAG TPA: efflux RND transporter periplasmic adaptor subunit [Bacteroidales bacterium]|nr:efflux RND transporter periplasmic adaptor subunit [Bacteroidales bacterium]